MGAGQEACPPPGVRREVYRPGAWPAAALGVARAVRGGLPLQSGLFYQPDLGRQLRRLAPAADLVVLQLARLVVHLEDIGAGPLLVDLIDSLALNVERRAGLDGFWLRPALRLEARLLARAEQRLAERASGLLVVCERDRAALAGRLPAALGGRLRVVPLALEPAPMQQDDVGGGPRLNTDLGAGPLLAFTGNLGYFVNADALAWFLRAVWPALRARRPQVRLVAAGDRPSRAVRLAVARAGGAGGGVTLLASPADVRPVLAAATVALAPLRGGSGVPVKILEAWSAGVPVIASPWAAAGTTARPGEDLRVAATPEDWVEAVLDLLDRPAERSRLADNGRRRLVADYSRAAARAAWLSAVSAAV
jgi:glycosyltransferase involved in cell wall biosynthesis